MTPPPVRLLAVVVAACALAFACAAPASAKAPSGVQHLHYRFGPVDIRPGQNSIDFRDNPRRPKVAGYITAFRPNLTYVNGTIPPVDVIHLHHGVWLSNFTPLFAVGEEKTNVVLPRGFGWYYKPVDKWV